MKGPEDVSFAKTPTFFCLIHQHPSSVYEENWTYTRSFYEIQASLEVFGVLLWIFASNKDFQGGLSTFQALDMFRCGRSATDLMTKHAATYPS